MTDTTALEQAIENERIAVESYTEDYELAVRRQDWAAAKLYKEKARVAARILDGLREKRAKQRVEIPDTFDPLRGWYVNGWRFEWEHTGGGCMCWVGEQITDGKRIYFGTADENWGWCDEDGDEWGMAGYSTDMRDRIVPAVPSDTDALNPRVIAAITATMTTWKD